MSNSATRHVELPFAPILDENSEVLILGTVPSIASIEYGFYYGNPYNRFWPVLSALIDFDLVHASKEEKRAELQKRHIALYDVIYACDIVGSDDSKISNIQVSDVEGMMRQSKIRHIFLNGNKAYSEFKKHFPHLMEIADKLPSTSPRNARQTLELLIKEWSKIIEILNQK